MATVHMVSKAHRATCVVSYFHIALLPVFLSSSLDQCTINEGIKNISGPFYPNNVQKCY